MTFNGEIYNYIELRQGLIEDGYEFKTDSDSEVILGMYAKYKEKCLDYFRGMFGFVIWDKQEETLFALAINLESSLSIMLNQEMISTTLLKARPFTRFWKIKSSTRMHCKIT